MLYDKQKPYEFPGHIELMNPLTQHLMAFELFYVVSLRNIVDYNAHTHVHSFFLEFSLLGCRQNLRRVPGALPAFCSVIKLRFLWSSDILYLFLIFLIKHLQSVKFSLVMTSCVIVSYALQVKCYYLSFITPCFSVFLVHAVISSESFQVHFMLNSVFKHC